MKSLAVVLFAFCAVCSAKEEQSTVATVTATTVKPVTSETALPSIPKDSENDKPILELRRFLGQKSELDIQVERALSDRRYLQRQLKCVLGEGTCDPIGRKLKTLAPFVVRGNCPKCSPQEVKQIRTVLIHMQRKYPKEWGRVIRMYQ